MVVASFFPATTTNKMVGERIREARTSLGLTQKELCALIGMPLPTLRDQELCKRIPGGDALAAYMCAGISANWLLTGVGEMLISETHYEKSPSTELIAASPKTNYSAEINIDALTQAVRVMFKTAAAGETLDETVRKAVLFYKYCIDIERITPTGEGKGNDDNVV